MAKSSEEFLSAAKIAKLYGASPSEIKKAIQEMKIKPALTKGGCAYYSKTDIEKIKKHLKK